MALLRIKRTTSSVRKWKKWCCRHKAILEYLQQQGDLQVANVAVVTRGVRAGRPCQRGVLTAALDPHADC